jgi:hypothetical protein
MRTKVTLVLVFLNVALFFFIFKFERQWRTEAQLLEARRRVLGPEAVNIRALQVSGPAASGGGFTLEQRRSTWFLVQPLEWPADPPAVQSILNQLVLLQHETSFPVKDLAKSGLSLADYGLDKPKLTVSFASGDAASTAAAAALKTSLAIGDTTKDGKRVYILSPDGERVHIVERASIAGLFLPLEQLRAATVFTVPVFEAQSLSIQGTNRVSIRREGSRWRFNTPITARASKLVTEYTINLLYSLHAKSFPASPPTQPAASPTLRIVVEGNNRHETLFLGDPVAAPAPPKPAAGETPSRPAVEYYAQLEGRPVVFTVEIPNELMANLNNPTDRLREKRLLDFDPQAVTAVTLATQLQPVPPITLQWLDPAAPGADGATWQVVRSNEGGQGVQTAPADRAAVQRLLSDLLQLEARAFVSDNPSSTQLENWGFNRTEREITLSLASPATVPAARGDTSKSGAAGAGSTIVLRLATDPSGNVFARHGNAVDPGLSIYAVEVDIASRFPLEPAAWRDRNLPPIPANARIAALKLVDLASNETLVDTTLDPTGAPAAGARNPEAIRAVAQQLRTLRAQRFRPGPFVERIVVDGEERPWRYRLDATIALPGGTGEQTATRTLFLSERLGGSEQLAGSKDWDVVFEIEQPFLDELNKLTYGPRDPGPPPAAPQP